MRWGSVSGLIIQMQNKLVWYHHAARGLGLPSLARRQLQKRFGAAEIELSSKYLKHHVRRRRNSSDLYVFDQIFIELQYRCLDGVYSPKLIVDCGANVGYSTAYFLSKFPSSKVIAIEPDSENFRLLKKNAHPYGKRCELIQGAVWPKEELLNINIPTTAASEWAISVSPCANGQGSVQAITIQSLLAGEARISILKIDIEGAEYELFREKPDWLDRVDNIVIELHGRRCEEAFFAAITGRRFAISRCGELTVCLSSTDVIRND